MIICLHITHKHKIKPARVKVLTIVYFFNTKLAFKWVTTVLQQKNVLIGLLDLCKTMVTWVALLLLSYLTACVLCKSMVTWLTIVFQNSLFHS